MSKEIKRIPFAELEVGMIIKLCAGRSTRTRRIYKADSYTHGTHTYNSIWSIPVHWDKTKHQWVEECDMISNNPDRFNKIYLLEDNKWNEYRLEIIK